MKSPLVISNQCLSLSSANGRTIYNFVKLFDCCTVSNFYISGSVEECINASFFQLSDKDALKNIITFGAKGGLEVINSKECENNQNNGYKAKKRVIKYILRDIVWRLALRFNHKLSNWVDKIKPDGIIIFVADSSFLNDYARRISKKKKIPLITYSTENYCLKNYDYIEKKIKRGIIFRVFQKRLLNSTKKIYIHAIQNFLSTEDLCELFKNTFKLNNINYLYQCSYSCVFKTSNKPIRKLIYAGNLELNRIDSLIELANVVKTINCECIINVYSQTLSLSDEKKLESAHNINYCGFVPYNELQTKIDESDMILHCESFDNYNKIDLEYAFSTKISDSLMCGKPFFIYAPDNFSETKFMRQINDNFVASSADELLYKIRRILNGDYIYSINHDIIKNYFSPIISRNKLIKIINK